MADKEQNTKSQAPAVPVVKARVYWAPSSRMSMGGYRPEIKSQSGDVIQSENSLQFEDHCFTVDDDKLWRFAPPDSETKYLYQWIEAHNAFKNNTVKRAKSMEQALTWTHQHNQMKNVREFKTEDVTDVAGSR